MLMMSGVPNEGSNNAFYDNHYVIKNKSFTHSMSNRNTTICHHRVREVHIAATIRVGWINGDYNQSDLFTETSMSNERKYRIGREICGWRHNFMLTFE